MSTLLPGIRLMPFATDAWSPDLVRFTRQTRAGLEIAAPFPCVALDLASRTTLRLNNTRFDTDGMPDLSGSGGSEAMFIRDLIKRQCRPWDPQGHRLVDRYFEVLDELVRMHKTALAEKAAPFSGLYDANHWLFSAPRPYPRAHLFAPLEHPAPTLTPDDFVMVDFAFFLGPRLVAMLPAQSGLTPRKARERLERLERGGISVMSYGMTDLGDDAVTFFTHALTPRLPQFWSEDPIPMGPFRPSGIEE
jgi:hypothetical protein